MLDELDEDDVYDPATDVGSHQAPRLAPQMAEAFMAQETRRARLEELMALETPSGLADLLALLQRPAWMNDAACRDQPTELFFPGRGEDARPAKAICAQCPVRAECLGFALEGGDKHDIFGGMSERQRRQIRSERWKAAS